MGVGINSKCGADILITPGFYTKAVGYKIPPHTVRTTSRSRSNTAAQLSEQSAVCLVHLYTAVVQKKNFSPCALVDVTCSFSFLNNTGLAKRILDRGAVQGAHKEPARNYLI